MNWFKIEPGSGVSALFGAVPVARRATGDGQVDRIRNLMLECIEEAEAPRFPHVAGRIRCARDLGALWFLRCELFAALASTRGESAALEALEPIGVLFDSLVPEALRSRPRRG